MVHGDNLVTPNDDQLYNINIQKVNQEKVRVVTISVTNSVLLFIILFRKKKVGRVPGLIQLNFNRFNQLVNHFRLNQTFRALSSETHRFLFSHSYRWVETTGRDGSPSTNAPPPPPPQPYRNTNTTRLPRSSSAPSPVSSCLTPSSSPPAKPSSASPSKSAAT